VTSEPIRLLLRRGPLLLALALAAGCSVEEFGLEYPPGTTEVLHLSAFSPEERRMDTAPRSTSEGSASFPLLFSTTKNERADYVTTDIIYPLFSYRRNKDVKETAFRPLFYTKFDPVLDRTDGYFIYPLGRYRRDHKSIYFTFWPFFYNRQYRPGIEVNRHNEPSVGALSEFAETRTIPGENMNLDWALYPILFGGKDTSEGSYFAFFPFGGMIKGLIGKRWIRFVLFPLYMDTLDARYHAWSVIWPVFGWWRGPDQHGWRFWPFYGENTREGKFSRRFFLWPLGADWHVGLNTKNPTTVHAFLPFYAHMYNKHLNTYSILWPFFSRQYDDRRHYIEWHCPWPVFSYTRGDGIEGLKVWPFFGYRASNSRRNLTVMWPLYIRTQQRTEDRVIHTRSSCLIFYQWDEKWREYELKDKTVVLSPPRNDDGVVFGDTWIPDPRYESPVSNLELSAAPYKEYERVFWKLWPLCHYRKGADDSKVFQFLSPLPWRGNEGVANTYAPFWTLYRYERDAEGQKREFALFGLYHNIRDSKMRDVNVLGVVQYKREGWYYKRFLILGGLVGYERIGYDKGMRFLWLPINPIARDLRDRYRSGGFTEEER